MVTTKKSSLNQLQLRLHRAVEQIVPPEWKFDKTIRPYTIFWFILSGEKYIEVSDSRYKVEQGDLVIFPSQESFTIYENEQSTHVLDLALESKLGPFDLFKIYKFPIVTHLKSEKQAEPLLTLWNQIKEKWSDSDLNPFSSNSNDILFNVPTSVELLYINSLINEWLAELLKLIQPY